jgi:hypothetical protein
VLAGEGGTGGSARDKVGGCTLEGVEQEPADPSGGSEILAPRLNETPLAMNSSAMSRASGHLSEEAHLGSLLL